MYHNLLVHLSQIFPVSLPSIYSQRMRAILAGGGTGGHIIPALAIAQELKKQFDAEVVFVGTARGLETRLVPAAGFPLHLIEVGALNKVNLRTRLRTVAELPRSVRQALRLMLDFRPNIVIGVGGYASGPAMLAAILRRIPTLAFEPNYVPGFANRRVARWVSGAAVHFAATGRYFRNPVVTGVPVRQAFFEIPAKSVVEPPTLLVFGGSQGAHAINRAMYDSVADLRMRIPGLRVIHQTGERDYNDAEAAYSKLPEDGGDRRVEFYRFIDDMPGMFAQSDVIVCRSGASTVAEISAAGKPAVFIPFPLSADDHQKRNAEALEKASAAVMLQQSNLTPESLATLVTSLFRDPARLRQMGDAARKLSYPNAARDIAVMASRLARASKPQT